MIAFAKQTKSQRSRAGVACRVSKNAAGHPESSSVGFSQTQAGRARRGDSRSGRELCGGICPIGRAKQTAGCVSEFLDEICRGPVPGRTAGHRPKISQRRPVKPRPIEKAIRGLCGWTTATARKEPGKTSSWKIAVLAPRKLLPAGSTSLSWLKLLPRRLRKIALTLASGETTSAAAKKFAVSAARISQLRRLLKQSWDGFQGEPLVAA